MSINLSKKNISLYKEPLDDSNHEKLDKSRLYNYYLPIC